MIGHARRFLYEKGHAMQVAEIVRINGCQLVKLPEGFRLEGDTVSIRRQGESLVLQPIKPATWPLGFFDRIRTDDPVFARPDQGRVPPAPNQE
jgi:virulence-associated protein VagC